MEFESLGLHPSVMEGVASMGFKQLTPIQEQAIPPIMEGKDLIGCAQTGTGKTAAFLIPILHRLAEKSGNGIRCLILAPTRELVKQIDGQVQGLGYFANASTTTVYGGAQSGDTWETQKSSLSEGVDFVVAAPGRLMAHMKMGYVDFSGIQALILDEADKMLDMGFFEDITEIIKHLPADRQTLMFSATMPPKIRLLAETAMKDPIQINIAISKPSEKLNQRVFAVYDNQKIPLIELILKKLDFTSMVIFASRKSEVDQIARSLRKIGINAKPIHSDLEQTQREQVVLDFRNGTFNVLVATDVLSRGIDIDTISHVLNYDMPNDPEDYVHRIGRTGRAGASGVGISFVNPQDAKKLQRVEELIGYPITRLNVPPQLGYTPGKLEMDGRAPTEVKNGKNPRGSKRGKNPSKRDRVAR